MKLSLFEDVLKHMLQIIRLIEMSRVRSLLVCVGGSGSQSLTQLASFISVATCFKITLTKQYNINSLIDYITIMYKSIMFVWLSIAVIIKLILDVSFLTRFCC